MSWFGRMLDWMFGPRPTPDDSWPRHMFVQMQGKGLAYVDEVKDEEDASDLAQLVVGSVVMETGDMALARYWTTTRDAFTQEELTAYTARLTKAR